MSMTANLVDLPSGDDSAEDASSQNPSLAERLRLKEQECEELRKSVNDITRSTENLECELEKKEALLKQALERDQSTYQDCLRMDARLQGIEKLELGLQSSSLEIEKLKKTLADTRFQAQIREEDFEAEKITWFEERGRLQSRISSLVETLREARATSATSMPDSLHAKSRVSNGAPQAIPPETLVELCELRALVPAYVETLDAMEFTIGNLNVELDELHRAYSDASARNYEQQDLIEQLNQRLLLETDYPQIYESLDDELSHCAAESSSSSSSQNQTLLHQVRRSKCAQRNVEVEDLRETNHKLNDYLERLLDRIIGMDAFEDVLNLNFRAIGKRSSPRQPIIAQCPTLRAKRKVSSNIAMRTLRQLKVAKSTFLTKLNASTSSGVQVLAKSFLMPMQVKAADFATTARLGPSSVKTEYGPSKKLYQPDFIKHKLL